MFSACHYIVCNSKFSPTLQKVLFYFKILLKMNFNKLFPALFNTSITTKIIVKINKKSL